MTLLRGWPDQPFTLSDLRALEIPEARLRRAVRAGEVRSVVRGVFVGAEATDTIELRARAVARVVRPHHVATDRTAAWLHGVDVFTWAEHDLVPVVETCALRGHEPTSLLGVDGRTRDLRPGDITTVLGVSVTTPLRTALDLGCSLRRREAYAALNALAARHDLTREDSVLALPRFHRRRGVRQLRPLVQLVEPRLESERESWVLLAIHDATLAVPEPQYWIMVDDVPTFRLDFAYPRLRVCVEYDGEEWHDRTHEQRDLDRARRRWLRYSGWTVIVVKRGDFSGAALDAWTSRLRHALRPAYSNRRW
jgi:hypothetical protein